MALPYTEVEFDKKGALMHPAQLDDVDALIAEKNATDVVVLTHGWNNSPATARALYRGLIDQIDAARQGVPGTDGRRFVVVGVIWPSIQWAPPEKDGGGASVHADRAAALAADVAERVDDESARAKLLALIPELSDGPTQLEFVDVLRSTLPSTSIGEDGPAFTALSTFDASSVLVAAGAGEGLGGGARRTGGAASVAQAAHAPGLGGGGGIGGGAGFFDDVFEKVRNVLNVTTYYTMKERAGVVGTKGIAKLLDSVVSSTPGVRLHLVGHSFGGRAVTAAALAAKKPVASITLVQAAYSHFGMATDYDEEGSDGVFVGVPAKVSGPVVVTFSSHDKAVGLAYPVASRLARQIGQSVGDEKDPYGGIGANGALKTAGGRSLRMKKAGDPYDFTGADVFSLEADDYISGHSDIVVPEVGHAIVSAVMAAPAG